MAYFSKNNDGQFEYSYYGVDGHILEKFVHPDLINAYLEDEVFWEAVKNSYTNIDPLYGSKRDRERFQKKYKKTAEWLRKKANGIYF